MKLKFKNISRTSWVPDEGRLVAYLKDDNWDDYSFKTLYGLTVFDENGIRISGVSVDFNLIQSDEYHSVGGEFNPKYSPPLA